MAATHNPATGSKTTTASCLSLFPSPPHAVVITTDSAFASVSPTSSPSPPQPLRSACQSFFSSLHSCSAPSHNGTLHRNPTRTTRGPLYHLHRGGRHLPRWMSPDLSRIVPLHRLQLFPLSRQQLPRRVRRRIQTHPATLSARGSGSSECKWRKRRWTDANKVELSPNIAR